MSISLTGSEVGKKVVFDGEFVGRVEDVRHGTAYVDLATRLSPTTKSALGWGSLADEADTYPLEQHMVRQVTEERVHVR
jgi:hypothetical protein